MNNSLTIEKMFSPAVLNNFEQKEALQNEINEKNRLIAESSLESAKELKAVEEALNILTKAGVTAYIFPFMATNTERKGIRQYHNVDHFVKWKNDKLDKDSARLVCQINHSFIEYWFNFIKLGIMGRVDFSWDLFCSFIYKNLKETNDWKRDGTEFEEIVNYKERE